jgi:hypothetical protein
MGVDTGAKGFISISSTFMTSSFIGNGLWKGKDKDRSTQSDTHCQSNFSLSR